MRSETNQRPALPERAIAAAAPADAARSVALLDLYRRDHLLEAVADAARELLRSSDLAVSLPRVTERIGAATGVDRVHIMLVDGSASGRVLQHHLWTAAGFAEPEPFRSGAMPPLAEVGLQSWIPRLAAGETIHGHSREFEPPVRAFLQSLGIQSTLAVPVDTERRWLGLIAFDDCRAERAWTPVDIETIRILAELVGAAIARTRQVRSLADANRIIENSPTILFRVAPRPPFALTFLSRNIARYGYEAEALMAQPENWHRLIVADDMNRLAALLRTIAEGRRDEVTSEFRLRKPDGGIVWFSSHGSALVDGNGALVGIEGILTDITERKRAAEKIAALARTDALTGLPNRSAFLERLAVEFARARRGVARFAIHYLDLDHFKDVNDTLGHPVGDMLLRAVAARLKSCVRETDLVARFGGDEFAILQVDIAGPDDAEALAAKAASALAEPFDIGGNRVSTTASIGIVPWHADIAGTDAILVKADLALYRAKNEGRNQYRFHVAALDDETREHMLIGEELRHALERGEFELYYQPQIDLTSGAIAGLEALIRWNHPSRGLLLPSAFIPVAERTGSIVPIGEWVIGEACRQAGKWNGSGIAPPVVAVNLSGAQFKLASHLDAILAAQLSRCGIRPAQLELELTESVLIETTERHRDVFNRLRGIGVRLAIDDFGTGYSSLDYLRSFHVSRLKIDRRFIERVTESADDAAIVRAAVGLAHALGIGVIAEGVETGGQRDFLVAAGCEQAQGHLFGRPMPADAVATLLGRAVAA